MATVDGAIAGCRYLFRLDDSEERPDPASRYQPEGVHRASEVVDPRSFRWTDSEWKGLPLEDSIFYELHVGTFTPKGTFRAAIPFLDELAELGVSVVELMPIAQFPGSRNWGYDGVYPFAVQNSYGSPDDLRALIDAAHARGLGVALDIVYNHLGPEGNYLGEYGPYFTDRYHTPWGAALNFDGPDSDEVRQFFIQNALYWIEDFHLDALRLDAIHGIFDASAIPFLAELSTAVRSTAERLHRRVHLIAESDLNDVRVLRSVDRGGFGMDAQWSDDFHHSVHTLLTGERSGYYGDFGSIHHLAETLKHGWYYHGQFSRARRRKHGNWAANTKPKQFVVCDQNHDQVGNRAFGERLSTLVSFESLKLAAGVTILSPFLPLLFMGEEYGETAAFQYFISHGDAALAEAVRRGRSEEFLAFEWQGEIPDPQSEKTFTTSKLHHKSAGEEPHQTLRELYKFLLRFRREYRLASARQLELNEFERESALTIRYQSDSRTFILFFHFGEQPADFSFEWPGTWTRLIDSADLGWLGPGASTPATIESATVRRVRLQPRSFAVFESSNASLKQ